MTKHFRGDDRRPVPVEPALEPEEERYLRGEMEDMGLDPEGEGWPKKRDPEPSPDKSPSSEETKVMLQKYGWVMECESPLEIRAIGDGFATREAAEIVIEHLWRLESEEESIGDESAPPAFEEVTPFPDPDIVFAGAMSLVNSATSGGEGFRLGGVCRRVLRMAIDYLESTFEGRRRLNLLHSERYPEEPVEEED